MRKKLTLPPLPGKYRWELTPGGARIFEDLRAKHRGNQRRNVGHYTTAVLRHVLLGERLEGEKWHCRARALQRVLKSLEIQMTEGAGSD